MDTTVTATQNMYGPTALLHAGPLSLGVLIILVLMSFTSVFITW